MLAWLLGNLSPFVVKSKVIISIQIYFTATPFATISGIFRAQMVSSPALSADPKDDVEEW